MASCFARALRILSSSNLYKLFAWKVVNRWEWDQITAIRPDFKKAKPNILLEIAKDVILLGETMRFTGWLGALIIMVSILYMEFAASKEASKQPKTEDSKRKDSA